MDGPEQPRASHRAGWFAGLNLPRIILGAGAITFLAWLVGQTESRWGIVVLWLGLAVASGIAGVRTARPFAQGFVTFAAVIIGSTWVGVWFFNVPPDERELAMLAMFVLFVGPLCGFAARFLDGLARRNDRQP